jgi:DNA-binding response OmpR family regulator
MTPTSSNPDLWILLVEDDPASASFMEAIATSLPAQVRCADSLAEAETACRAHRFDLLLIDANLPDGRGEHLLYRLRAQGIQAPALAHTADPQTTTHIHLRAAGFAEILVKPIRAADLRAALRRHLPQIKADCWDDTAALAALGGQHEHVKSMRALFLGELPAQRRRIVEAATHADTTALRAELHRLTASCGFVGATELASAIRHLQANLLDPMALHAVETAIDTLLSNGCDV